MNLSYNIVFIPLSKVENQIFKNTIEEIMKNMNTKRTDYLKYQLKEKISFIEIRQISRQVVKFFHRNF